MAKLCSMCCAHGLPACCFTTGQFTAVGKPHQVGPPLTTRHVWCITAQEKHDEELSSAKAALQDLDQHTACLEDVLAARDTAIAGLTQQVAELEQRTKDMEATEGVRQCPCMCIIATGVQPCICQELESTVHVVHSGQLARHGISQTARAMQIHYFTG